MHEKRIGIFFDIFSWLFKTKNETKSIKCYAKVNGVLFEERTKIVILSYIVAILEFRELKTRLREIREISIARRRWSLIRARRWMGNYEIGGIFLFCHRVSFNFHPSTIPERNLRLHTRPGVADACPTPKQESLRCNWNYAFIPMRRGGNFERTALLEAELLLLEGE